jgi:type IV pilus assembly protein PilA
MKTFMDSLQKRRINDKGFTLIELLVVILILAILVAIAIPVYLNHQRQATIATLKSDLTSSTRLLPNVSAKTVGAFPSPENFKQEAVTSKDNVLALTVTGTGYSAVACITGSHSFSATDVVSFHYNTTTQKVEAGPCDAGTTGGGGNGTTTPGGGTTTPGGGTVIPAIRDTNPTDAGLSSPEGIPQSGPIKGAITYSPQATKLSFCFKVDVTTTSTTPIAWEYALDLNAGPFWGANPSTFTESFAYQQKSLDDGLWVVRGIPGTSSEMISAGDKRTFGFCAPEVPQPPLNAAWSTTTVSPDADNDNKYACVNLSVKSTSLYPVPWTATVDLKEHFKSIQGKKPVFTNLTMLKDKGDYVYEVTGNGYTSYVSASDPRTKSLMICYSPGGQPW